MAYPSAYPTGTTVYNPEKACNGFTIYPSAKGALLIDMNGREVNLWAGLEGQPNKILPGGYVMGSTDDRPGWYQDQTDLVQVDWDGNIVWRWNQNELVEDEGFEPQWMARQHHDYEREGSSVGYYAPGMEPRTDGGNTIMLVHHEGIYPRVSDKLITDDRIVEIDWEGNIVWQWDAADHVDEFGFSSDARKSIYANPNEAHGHCDWLHCNCVSTLGPNKWYDAGDERFAPENIIFDSREGCFMAIISKKTGELVWRLGPDFGDTPETAAIGQIIGQHSLHMIPKGLPGEGDLLLLDNGSFGGYGPISHENPTGKNVYKRNYSRVLQINPVTLEVTWQCTPEEMGIRTMVQGYKFFTALISNVQRLPNGNTLIVQGNDGIIIEVTPDYEIVWEYVVPYAIPFANSMITNTYRAYRVPYEWVPQAEKPVETAIIPPERSTWRVPGASNEILKVTTIEGVDPNRRSLPGMMRPRD